MSRIRSVSPPRNQPQGGRAPPTSSPVLRGRAEEARLGRPSGSAIEVPRRVVEPPSVDQCHPPGLAPIMVSQMPSTVGKLSASKTRFR
jgi:hypothetical protein